MTIGQIASIKIDAHKRNDFLKLLKEYKPEDVENIVPQEMIEMIYMHDKKTKAD